MSRRRGATFAIVLLKLLYLCDPGRALPRSGLYPYGERIGDALVPPGDDASAGVSRLRHRYRVYSRAYRSLHVSVTSTIVKVIRILCTLWYCIREYAVKTAVVDYNPRANRVSSCLILHPLMEVVAHHGIQML